MKSEPDIANETECAFSFYFFFSLDAESLNIRWKTYAPMYIANVQYRIEYIYRLIKIYVTGTLYFGIYSLLSNYQSKITSLNIN